MKLYNRTVTMMLSLLSIVAIIISTSAIVIPVEAATTNETTLELTATIMSPEEYNKTLSEANTTDVCAVIPDYYTCSKK